VRRVYRNLAGRLARCIWRVFARDNTANRIPRQTINNAPDVDMSRTTADIGRLTGVSNAAGTTLPGDENRGRFGTLRIANDIPDIFSPQLRRTVTSDEIAQRTYAHELGNLLSRRYGNGSERTFGDPNGRVGVSGIRDYDTGSRLEECIFGNIAP
jgi:hypothetical protein